MQQFFEGLLMAVVIIMLVLGVVKTLDHYGITPVQQAFLELGTNSPQKDGVDCQFCKLTLSRDSIEARFVLANL